MLPSDGTPVTAWACKDAQTNAYETARSVRYRARRLRYREPAHGHWARYGWFTAVRVHAAGTTLNWQFIAESCTVAHLRAGSGTHASTRPRRTF